jgi:O-antigen/teichoic acid export membrane protein
MRGFAHFDMYRAQREMRFWPSIKVDIASIAGSTIAVVPLYFVFHDFRLMLCAILLQQVLFVLLSHLVAERKYRWQWDSATVRHAFAFGWPLLLNGVLMFLTFNGDRILVGNIFGMRDLGLFSAAFTITLAPTLVIAKTLNSFFLPLLSRSQSNKSEFRNLYLVTTQAALLAGALVAFVFAFAGPTLMIMVFGTDYVSAAPIVTWLGLMQAVRLAKAGPAIVATAKGETKNPMLANVARISIMPIAYLAVRNGFGLTAIVGLATLGEAFALLVSLYLLRSRLHMPLRMATSPLIVSSLVLGTVGIGDLLPSGAPIDMRIGQFFVALALILLLIRVMPDLRKWGVLAAPNLLK